MWDVTKIQEMVIKIPCTIFRKLIERLLKGVSVVPDHLARYAEDPDKLNITNTHGNTQQFKCRRDFDLYTRLSLSSHNKGVSVVISFQQWLSHYEKVMASDLSMQRKVNLLILGGFPQKHKSGGFTRLVTTPLSQKRINFFKAVIKMVRLSD